MASDLISKRMMLRTLWEAWSDSTPHIMLFNGKLQCSQRSKDIQILMNFVEKYPTVDAAPVVHGEWKISSDGYYPYCSICNYRPKGGEMTKHCPDCGAKMDGGIGTAEDICKTTNIPCIKCNPGPCEHRKKG